MQSSSQSHADFNVNQQDVKLPYHDVYMDQTGAYVDTFGSN